jgi:hypothetical protein
MSRGRNLRGAAVEGRAVEELGGAESTREDALLAWRETHLPQINRMRLVDTKQVLKAAQEGRKGLMAMMPRALKALDWMLDPDNLTDGRYREASVSRLAVELYFKLAWDIIGDVEGGGNGKKDGGKEDEGKDFTVRVVKGVDGQEGVEMTVRGRGRR